MSLIQKQLAQEAKYQRQKEEYAARVAAYVAEHASEAQPAQAPDGTWLPPLGEWHLFHNDILGWYRGARYDARFPWRIATENGIDIANDKTLCLPMPAELEAGPYTD
jgi:hypothetical protein